MAKAGASNSNPKSSPSSSLHSRFSKPLLSQKILITKVTFTLHQPFSNIHLVVWQFWGRAAEASWTAKSEALFLLVTLGLGPVSLEMRAVEI